MVAGSVSGREDDRLVDLIYDAAFDETLWQSLLADLADRAGAQPANLLRINIVDGHGFGIAARAPDDSVACYFAHWAQRNPIGLVDDPFDYRRDWAPRILRDEESIDRAALERSAYWNEFLTPIGAHHMITMRLALRDHDLTSIGFGRPARFGGFDEDEIAALVPFHRHLIRAERMGRSLGLRRAQFDQFDTLLATSSEAMFFLDDSLRPQRWTAAAEALLRRGTSLRIVEQRLHALTPVTDQALQRALAAALAGGAPTPVTVDSGAGEVVTLSIARLGERTAAGGGDTRCVMIVARPRVDAACALRARFGLTAAEAGLALALRDGETLHAVATRRNVSLNTVRNQLRAIFDKTGHHRQQDLVRMLASER